MTESDGASRRVLVVNFGDPERNPSGSGEQMLRSMFGDSRDCRLERFSFSARKARTTVPWLDASAELYPAPLQPFPGALKLPFVGNRLDRRAESMAKVVAADRPWTQHGTASPDVTWLVLNDPTTIYLGERLIETGESGRVIVSIWDTPEWLAHERALTIRRRRRLRSAFDRVLSVADQVFTISAEMSRRYAQTPGVVSTAMYATAPLGCEHEPRGPAAAPLVAFAGSLYATREWETLLDSIEGDRRIQSAGEISVSCIGSLRRGTKKRDWVTYVDPQSPSIAAKLLSQASVGYLPYPRSRSKRELVATTFPSKLAFYLTAGLPVLFHGPDDCAAAAFVREHGVGTVCDTDDPDQLVAAVHRLSADESFRAQFTFARQGLMANELSPLAPARAVRDALCSQIQSECGREL